MALESRGSNTFLDFEEIIGRAKLAMSLASPSNRRQDHEDYSSHLSQGDMHKQTSQKKKKKKKTHGYISQRRLNIDYRPKQNGRIIFSEKTQ